MIFQIIAFVFGAIVAFIIGFFETYLLKLKAEKIDKIILSFGLGNATVVLTLFIINQYLGMLLTTINILISVFLTFMSLFVLCIYKKINLIKEIKSLFELRKIRINKVFLLLLVIFYTLCFYKAIFFPEVNWDSIYGFLYWPKVVWNEHTIPVMSSSYHELGMAWGNQNFPVLLNTYFFAIYGKFDELFIKILIPLWSIFNILIVYRITYLLSKNKIISMLSSTFFLSSNVFTAYSVFTVAPMYEIFYPLLALYFYILYEKCRKKPILIISSILFGITLAMKLVWIPLFVAFIISTIIVKKDIKKSLTILIIAISVSLLFYLRNIMYYHNPFFPLYFGGLHYNNFLSDLFWKSMMVPDFTNFSRFFDAILKTGIFTWVFFILFGIFFLRKRNSAEKVLYLSVVLYIPVWILSSGFLLNTDGQRHLLPSLGLMSIFAGAYFLGKINKKISLRFAFLPLIITIITMLFGINFHMIDTNLFLLITLPPMLITPFLIFYKYGIITKRKLFALVLISLMITPIGYVSFMKKVNIWEFPTEEEVISRYWDDIYTTGKYINENLPEDAKIFSLENRRYYFDRDVIPADRPDMIFDYQNQTLDHVLKELYGRGIYFILINQLWKDKGLWNYSTIHQNADTLDTSKNLEKIFHYKNITLYEIVYE